MRNQNPEQHYLDLNMKVSCVIRGNFAFVLAFSMFFIGPLSMVFAAEGHYKRNFEWYYKGKKQRISLLLSSATYDHYKGKPRTWHYGHYTTEDPGHEVIHPIAVAFKKAADEQGLDEWGTINYLVSFVQSIQYEKDEGEYPRYPIETLVDGEGDCEDTAILLGAILDDMKYDCVLLSPPGHMALGVSVAGYKGKYYPYNGKKYYYIETTGSNWEIGEIPEVYSGAASVFEFERPAGKRNPVAFADKLPDTDSPGEMYIAFYRSEEGKSGVYGRKKAYRYAVRLEGDADLLDEVKEVKYQRVHRTFQEYKSRTWITKNSRHDNFKSEWTGWAHAPIKVKVVFRDGDVRNYLIEQAPKVASLP